MADADDARGLALALPHVDEIDSERDWMAEEFTRGCYGAHFASGAWTSYGRAWRAPIGRLHWAGAECAPPWNGYTEGAVRSGEAAADAVAAL